MFLKGNKYGGKFQQTLLEWVSGYFNKHEKNKAVLNSIRKQIKGRRRQREENPQQVFDKEGHSYVKGAEENKGEN